MKMNRIAGFMALIALTACSGGNSDSGAGRTPAQDDALALTQDQLRQTLANQDSILSIMNSIGDGITRLKEAEGIINSPSFASSSPESRAQVIADIASIQQELESRRAHLAELEKKLKDSRLDNDNLHKAIATLKTQIDQQESTIAQLRGSLAEANVRIETLTGDIRDLNSRIDSVTIAKDDMEERLNTELNTVFYAMGNKKELKEHSLIETGFLRKTKVLPGDFEAEYFTPVDKRTLSRLPLLSKKAKIMTGQPEDSYSITTDDIGLKVLDILDPDRFWAVSNFLVIQID